MIKKQLLGNLSDTQYKKPADTQHKKPVSGKKICQSYLT